MKLTMRRWVAGVVLLSQLTPFSPQILAASAAEAGRRPERPEGPRPPVLPSSSEIEQARRDGVLDAEPDGAREGRERGWDAGIEQGRQRGYREGYDRCVDQRRKQAYDAGYFEGVRSGGSEGQRDGQSQGYSQGQAAGARAGEEDGNRKALAAARRDAEGPGREQGYREAAQTDAQARGSREGAISGEARALKTAQDVDYPRGRESHRAERYNEPVRKEVTETLAAQRLEGVGVFAGAAMRSALLETRTFSAQMASPDYRYARERRQYSDGSLQLAYSEGYRSGYRSGFESAYSSEFRRGEVVGAPQGREQGCRDADRVNVRLEFDRGRADGYRRGYREAYDDAYRVAYRFGYDPAFTQASEDTYRYRYPEHYRVAFESFRIEAYESRVQELYRAGFERSSAEAYQRTYPAFSVQEFQRGVNEEASEFARRPVRLADSGFDEQFADSVIEPGESIAFRFRLRNFSDQDLDSSGLRLEVETSGPGILPVRRQDSSASRIPARGALSIKGAVPVIVTEAALGQKVSATVKVYWRGVLLETRSFDFSVRTRATVVFAERPVIREGLESLIRVQIRNASTQAITGPVRLELRADTRQIELLQSVAEVTTMEPGDSREVTFRVVGRSDQDSLDLPLAVVASDGSSKQLAVRDFSGRVPVLNDYRVKVISGKDSLRGAGVVRLGYVIRNVSSRLVFGALELYARVLDANGKDVPEARWIGFNPQFLLPLARGEESQFVIPVVLPQGLSGGTVELEVRENGVPVVIHQARF